MRKKNAHRNIMFVLLFSSSNAYIGTYIYLSLRPPSLFRLSGRPDVVGEQCTGVGSILCVLHPARCQRHYPDGRFDCSGRGKNNGSGKIEKKGRPGTATKRIEIHNTHNRCNLSGAIAISLSDLGSRLNYFIFSKFASILLINEPFIHVSLSLINICFAQEILAAAIPRFRLLLYFYFHYSFRHIELTHLQVHVYMAYRFIYIYTHIYIICRTPKSYTDTRHVRVPRIALNQYR